MLARQSSLQWHLAGVSSHGFASKGWGSAHPTVLATSKKTGGLLSLFAYLAEISFLGDVISK